MCWKKTQGVTWISRVPGQKGELPGAVVGCLCRSGAWPRPSTGCWLLLLHVPWLSRRLDIDRSPLPASETFLPTAPEKQGWPLPGPLPSRGRPYASMVEHSSRHLCPCKGAPAWQRMHSCVHSSLPHRVPSNSLLHGAQSRPHHKVRKTWSLTWVRGFRGLNQLSGTSLT